MSDGDASSDRENVSTSKQAARVLQGHFDREGDDTRPTDRIPMET